MQSGVAATEKRAMSRGIFRIATVIVLVLLGLFYLQFGLQALIHFLPQGVLSVVGGLALGWGAVLTFRRHPASAKVFLGTVPILLLHAVMTVVDPSELPFLIGSAPIPLVAGFIWFIRRSRIPAAGQPS
jgi:hypothetical protein